MASLLYILFLYMHTLLHCLHTGTTCANLSVIRIVNHSFSPLSPILTKDKVYTCTALPQLKLKVGCELVTRVEERINDISSLGEILLDS